MPKLPLFSTMQLKYGPIGLIGRSILQAIQLVEEQNVQLAFCTAREFLEANTKTDDWLPLLPLFDCRFSHLDDSNSFFIVGRSTNGEIVACQAARYMNWTDTNFRNEAESLRLFYQDPKSMMRKGELCSVSSIAAGGTTGRVLFSGGAWYRKDYRGRGFVNWLPRIARAYAHSKWNTNLTVTIMAEANVKKGVFPRNGYTNIEWAVDFVNAQFGDLKCAYLWIKHDELLSDLEAFELSGNAVNIGHSRAVGT
jgi:hypothetical protein